jgi:hypothetical protein
MALARRVSGWPLNECRPGTAFPGVISWAFDQYSPA